MFGRRPRDLHRTETHRIVALLVMVFLAPLASFAARPDYDKARSFGGILQADYNSRHSGAIIDRLDSSAMMERVFSAALVARDDRGQLAGMWQKQLLPALSRQLQSLDRFSTLVVSRVDLCDDARELECLLLDDQGTFQLATLRLVESPAGEVRIADLRFGGSHLELTRAMRHLFLVLQVPLAPITDPEEIDLVDLGKTSRERTTMAMEAFGQQRFDESFNLWNSVSPRLKKTRIWQEMRTRMAISGGKLAMRDLERETRGDLGGNPFLRLSNALLANDNNRALIALDELLLEYQHLAFLRATKAALLVRCGRPAEALQIAEDVCQTTPLTGSAYVAAIHAAMATNQPERALESLQRWALLLPPREISRLLESDAESAAFLASPQYAKWRTGNPVAAAATGPEQTASDPNPH